MSDTEKDMERPDEWLLIKRDLYWRPNSSGYTGLRDEAGRYTYAEASPRCNGGVSMVHISEAPEFRAAVWDDLLVAHLLKQRSERDDTITTLRAEVERLTEERETIFMDIVDERDAAIARAEKAEAAITDLASRAQKILDALNADYSKPTDGDDKWKGGFDDGIKTAASLVHAFASHAFRASLTEGE